MLPSYRPCRPADFVVTFEDITERLVAKARIKHLAHYDTLTDLPNRVTFYERIESVLSTCDAPKPSRFSARSRPFQSGQRYARPSGRGPVAEGGRRTQCAVAFAAKTSWPDWAETNLPSSRFHPNTRRILRRLRLDSSRSSERPTISTATRSSWAPASELRSHRPTAACRTCS